MRKHSRRLLGRARYEALALLVRGIALASRTFFEMPPRDRSLVEVRVMTGHLRGNYYAMSGQLSRPGQFLGAFERHVVRAMREHVRAGHVVYDVGASFGYHTLFLSRLAGPAGRVLAFEPEPRDRRILERNVEANRLANVTVSPLALSDESGPAEFARFSYPGVGHLVRADTAADAQIETVEAATLDSLVYEQGWLPPDFMKVDIEGGEAAMLRGARRVLEEARPVIVAEIAGGPTWERVVAMMAERGYVHRVLPGSTHWPQMAEVLFIPAGAARTS